MEEKTKKVLNRLEGQCSKREYCSTDVYAKALKGLEGDAEAAREVLESLLADGFVSDLRYATAFAREKSSLTGWGPIKIRYALLAKKIDPATIDEALSETDDDKARQKLERLIEAKRKTLEGDPQMKLKLIRFALSRGYDYDKIKDLISK